MSAATAVDGDFVIGGRTFASRLIVGTGKYRSSAEMVATIRASGAEMVTVAVRRVNLDRGVEEGILHHLDPAEFFLLPNTAGCYTVADALRYARLGRAAGLIEWVKLEVIGDERTLLPDTAATIEAVVVVYAIWAFWPISILAVLAVLVIIGMERNEDERRRQRWYRP